VQSDALDFGAKFHEFLASHYRGEVCQPSGDDTAQILASAYVSEWFDADQEFSVESVEERHTLALFAGIPDRFLTILDLVVVDARGDRWLVEHKTSSGAVDPNQTRWRTKAFDLQTQLYLRALHVLGRPARGVVFNVIRRPLLRQKRAESYDEFLHRMRLEVTGPEYFQRFRVDHIESTERDLRFRVESLLQSIERCSIARSFPLDESGCFAYNRDCDFLPVCLGEKQLTDYPEKP
jgi:hypothetical protein